jgi:hypothetical protein
MHLPDEWNEFFQKFGGAVVTAILAICGKVSNEILMKRQITWISWIAIIGVSLFWAWMAGLFCAYMEYNYLGTSIIVGLATLMGEKINIYIGRNYKQIIEQVIRIIIPKK